MRIATWNVNSLKARLGFVEDWLRKAEPDICCLQETKMADAAFPEQAFSELGYESTHHGNGRWNGVAILSKVGLAEPRAGFVGERADEIAESRVLSALCGGIRVVSVYVPNGRSVSSEHYLAKLSWLEQLHGEVAAIAKMTNEVIVCGDFNIAPQDRDVWDIAAFGEEATHVTGKERSAFSRLVDLGLVDAVRAMNRDAETGPFTWWDYRAGAFHKGLGMRIDHVLISTALAAKLTSAIVDRDARKKGPGTDRVPSDHAPVIVEFA